MATITGTKKNVAIIQRARGPFGTLGVYAVTVDFAAYTGSTDSGALADVGAFISASVRDGKTRTLRSAFCAAAGSDGTQAVYVGDCTVSSDAMTFNLTDSGSSELTSTVATTVPVTLFVVCSEA